MIKIDISGENFPKTRKYFKKIKGTSELKFLDSYGAEGVQALAEYTPVDSGLTRESWHYRIMPNTTGCSLQFYNTNVQDGVPIAIILQYGHATRNGAWVEGKDYINPAIGPIFEEIKDRIWKDFSKKSHTEIQNK